MRKSKNVFFIQTALFEFHRGQNKKNSKLNAPVPLHNTTYNIKPLFIHDKT